MKFALMAGAFVFGVSLFSPTNASAWGRSGHELVGLVADQLLSDKAKQAIDQLRISVVDVAQLLTRDKPEYAWIDDNLRTFFSSKTTDLSLIANWADGWKFYGPGQSTYGWHFIDLPVEKDITVADVPSYYNHGDSSAAQIPILEKQLSDKTLSTVDRLKALFLLVHIVGDMGQPLHCASRNNDEGGNQERMKFFGQDRRLHQIWDDDLIDRGTMLTPDEQAKTGKRMDTSWADNYDGVSEQNAAQGTPDDWALESYTIAKTVIYPLDPEGSTAVAYDQPYEDQMLPIIKKQIQRAGVRVASLINAAFR
jgi:hypothetical protein